MIYNPTRVFNEDPEAESYKDQDYLAALKVAETASKFAIQAREYAIELHHQAYCTRRWAECKISNGVSSNGQDSSL